MLQKVLNTRDDVTLAIVRLVLGGVMFAHGAQKMLGWFGGYGFTGTMGYFESQHIPAVLAFLALQLLIAVCMIEAGIPLWLGTAHNAGAALLLLATVALYDAVGGRPVSPGLHG